MGLTLTDMLPNSPHTLDGSCFIFGAGTSAEAGYPMMPALTRMVVGKLSRDDRRLLDRILAASAIQYREDIAAPNIEEIADLVMAHSVNSGLASDQQLEATLREFLVSEILSVREPDLTHHIRLFDALRRRAYGLKCCVSIITTNYDTLFEVAAAQTRVPLINGFCGATTRYFDPAEFDRTSGSLVGGRFTAATQLSVRLIKLHGSLSWYTHDGEFFETNPQALGSSLSRVVVLPRRKKVIETLARPYDQLFGRASRMVGTECRYVVSCGFSFGDHHINETILVPQLTNNRIRLTAFCKEETEGISAFKSFPSFNAGFSNGSIIGGVAVEESTDLWKFSNFVQQFG